MNRILVVEDNQDLAFGLRNNLEIEGYEVVLAQDGQIALNSAAAHPPDLVILDLMLPDTDGFRVLQTLREHGSGVPVLILTARGEEADKVRGLRLGADDYVTKPFGILELMARVDALLRRVSAGASAAKVTLFFDDVEVHRSKRQVLRGGLPVELTPKEFDLLIALLDRRGDVVSRSDLMREVWGYADTVITRTVDTHIAELRRKLEPDAANPTHILTVRKVGYRLS